MNSEIERNVMLKAKSLEAKPMKVVKVPDEASAKDSKSWLLDNQIQILHLFAGLCDKFKCPALFG